MLNIHAYVTFLFYLVFQKMADGLVQTFFFRAVNDMEKNQVKHEERLRKKGGGDWFDIGELSTLLCELDAVATQVGKLL